MRDTVNLVFIGHVGTKEMLSGIGLGNMAFNFIGLQFLFGMNNAIETLVSQAAGAKDLKLCGVYLNRGRYLLAVFLIPITCILLKVEPLLVFLGQDEKACYYAQIYINYQLPAFYFRVFDDIQRKFLNSLKLNTIPMTAEIFGLMIHILGNYIFVIKLDLGIEGTALANGFTSAVVLAFNVIYANCIKEIAEAVAWPDDFEKIVTRKGMWSYVSIGLPVSIMRIGGSGHVMTFTTGLLGVRE